MKRDLFTDGTLEAGNAGLSEAGRDFVREANRLGIVIDVSHTGERSSLEMIELSEDPVIFSHSNAKVLCPSSRNLANEQLDAVAAKGGVIGITTFSPLLRPDVTRLNRPTVEDVLTHIDYVVQRVGIDHVGLGMDWGHQRRQEDLDLHNRAYKDFNKNKLEVETAHAHGLDGPQDFVNVTELLLARKYKDEEIGKILSRNFLRVFEAVWAH
jgi:membrane dipeptidase